MLQRRWEMISYSKQRISRPMFSASSVSNSRHWISSKWLGQQGSCPGSHTTKGARVVTGIFGNVVPVKSGFHTGKNFSEYYSQFGRVPSETFLSLAIGQNFWRISVLGGAKLFTCLGLPQESVRPRLHIARTKNTWTYVSVPSSLIVQQILSNVLTHIQSFEPSL
jgi:hypothetical protein